MTKNADTRLTETIAFVQANPVAGFIGDFNAVVAALTAWNTTANPAVRTTLSKLMSQENAANRPGNKKDRAYRRASIMLQCALAEPQANWATIVRGVNVSTDPELGKYVTGLNQGRDGHFSSAAVAQENLNLLQAHPRRFLERFKLTINGKPTSQRCTYGFYMVGGTYKLDCILPGRGQVTVDAINVPATPYARVQAAPANITATLSSLDAACTLMLTTQFTGCCYCFMVNGGALAAAHIDPQGKATGTTGQQVSQDMRDNGGFANGNGGTFKAYGRIADGAGVLGYPMATQQMTIVGVKRGADWRVYAQIELGTHREVERIDG
jgi:hypothetical protein